MASIWASTNPNQLATTNPDLTDMLPEQQPVIFAPAASMAQPGLQMVSMAPKKPSVFAPIPESTLAQPDISGMVPQQSAEQVMASIPQNQAKVRLMPQAERVGEQMIDRDSSLLQKLQQPVTPFHELSTGKKIGRIFADIGNVAGDIFAPSTMALIPGTALNRNVQEGELNNRLQREIDLQSMNQLRDAQEQEAQERTKEMPQQLSDTEKLENAQIIGLLNPQAKTAFQAWREQNPTAPVTDWLNAQAEAKPDKQLTPQEQAYNAYIKQGLTPEQAYEKVREKPPVTNEGTWTLDEDPKTGKPILFNNKTGETKNAPEGVAKAGTYAKSQAATKPAKDALKYANDYESQKLYTGSGDEALMEQFFELAKPATGFRMSQPQIDMLKNARSWMSSVRARLYHAATGRWFDDEQLEQIVATMRDLAKAKGITEDSTEEPAAQTGGIQGSAPQPNSGTSGNNNNDPFSQFGGKAHK